MATTTVLSVYREALRLIGEHDIASTSEDVEARYVLDAAYDGAVAYCLSLGWWRFALVTATQAATTSTVPGYSRQFTKPADWIRTHSVCVTTGTRSIPVDWMESGSTILCKYASVTHRYIQDDVALADWPEVFAKLVAAYLALDVVERLTQTRTTKADIGEIFQQRLADARVSESVPPPRLLAEHAVEYATRHVLEQGFWRFSVNTVDLAHNAGLTASSGFSYRAAKPADWMRTYLVAVKRDTDFYPVDYRDTGGNLHTDYAAFALQYVSTDAIDPSTWPEAFRQAVDAYLEVEAARANGGSKSSEEAKLGYDKVLAAALSKEGLPRPLMLAEGDIRRATRTQLEQGLWKFATVTASLSDAGGTPSVGYSYRFTKPADWVRTVRVYSRSSGSDQDIDFRDEGGYLHANYDPVYVRYISSDAIDPDNWTELFTASWFALLRYEEARSNGMPAGEVQARYVSWRKHLGEALLKDGLNERPKVNRTGIFNAARRGATGNREQG